ncbi:MAG: hypothetical protein R2831_10870 [Chitinophagaceae bacterium]
MKISVTHVPHLNGSRTPARCNRRTGQIWINDEVMRGIPHAHRYFILLHELGHITLNTSNELEADRFAFKHFIESGYPLTESVKALSRVLTGSNDEHVDRVATQIERAKYIDSFNPKTNNMTNQGLVQFDGDVRAWYDYDQYDGEVYTDSLFGLGKKAQARKKARQDAKNYARMKKADARFARADAKNIKAQAKQTLAEQGIVDSGLGQAVGGLVNAVGSGQGSEQERLPAPPTPPKKSKTLLIVLGAVALVGIGVFIYFKTKKK